VDTGQDQWAGNDAGRDRPAAGRVATWWETWWATRQTALDDDAWARHVAPLGGRFSQPLARYTDPMAWWVRFADRVDRTQADAAHSPAVVDRPSRRQAWTSPHITAAGTYFPGWVGWLPALRGRQTARRLLGRRVGWTRVQDWPARVTAGRARVAPHRPRTFAPRWTSGTGGHFAGQQPPRRYQTVGGAGMRGRNLGGGATVAPTPRGGTGRGRGRPAMFGGGGGGGRAGGGSVGIFQPVVDEANGIAARFTTEGALSAVNVADTAGEAVAALGRAFSQVGQRAADEIAWESASSEFFQTFGQHLINAAETIRDLGAQVRRIEGERIDRLEDPRPNERPWDISANER
jgi:hypothetical protein